MITKHIIRFFKATLGVDVSDVEVSHKGDFSDCSGFYEHYSHRINTDKELQGVEAIYNVVHELAHLAQFEHNVSISLGLSNIVTAEDYAMADMGIVWYDRSLEIDADLLATYYLYRQYSNIADFIKCKFGNVTDYEHLCERIMSIEIDLSYKSLLIDTLLV